MVMDISNSGLGLFPYYIMGGLVVVLLLLLVSFILNNKRASRIEAVMEDMQERLVQFEVALADADKSLDELFGKRRANGGQLDIPTDLESLTFVDEQGQTHNLKETIESLKQQIDDVGSEQQRYYESIIQEQQVLVESVSSLKNLIASIQAERSTNNVKSASVEKEVDPLALHQNNANQYSAYQEQENNSFEAAEQAFNKSSTGIFMPPGANASLGLDNQDQMEDATFVQTASDIAKLVAKTDFSAIDPNSAPATIGEHMQNAHNQHNRAQHTSNQRPNSNRNKGNRSSNNGYINSHDPMNPMGINNQFAPSSTFGAPRGNQAAMGHKENPTPGLQSSGQYEVEIPSPSIAQGHASPTDASGYEPKEHSLSGYESSGYGSTESALPEYESQFTKSGQSTEELQSLSVAPSLDSELVLPNEDNNPQLASEGLLSLESGSQLNNLDFNDVLLPPQIDINPSIIGDTSEVALGMDRVEPQLSEQNESSINNEGPNSDGWQLAEVEPRAAFADEDLLGAMQDKPSLEHELEDKHGSLGHGDDARFDVLESFSKLYNNAVQDDNSTKPNNLLESSFGSEQSVNQATSNTQLTIDYTSSDSLDNLDNLKVTVNHEMSSGVQNSEDSKSNLKGDMSAANVDYLKIPQDAPVVDMIYDHNYVQQQKDKRPNGISIDTLDKAKSFIEAGVSLTEISAKTGLSEDEIKLIYDVDENGKIKDTSAQFKKQALEQELMGSEASAKSDNLQSGSSSEQDQELSSSTSGSEINQDSPISALSDEEKAALNISDKESKSTKSKDKKRSLSSSKRKSRALEEPNSPSAALDKDERMVIESMMQEKHDPFSPEVAQEVKEEFSSQESTDSQSNIEPVPAPVSEELSEEEALAASLLSREALENGQLPELSQEADFKAAVEQSKLEREQALSSSIEEIEASQALEGDLDAIDRLANSIISENEKNGLLSVKDNTPVQHMEQDIDVDDPLNVLSDFKHKKGSSVAALAQSIKNTSDDYMTELAHDIDDALEDDSVTIGHTRPQNNSKAKKSVPKKENMTVEERVKANRQKISSLSSTGSSNKTAPNGSQGKSSQGNKKASAHASSNNAPSQAARAAMQANKLSNARKRKVQDQGAIGAIGSATTDRSYDIGMDSPVTNARANRASMANQAQSANANPMRAQLDKGPQSSGRGLSALLGSDIDDDRSLEQIAASRAMDKPIKSNSYPRVDEALAQIDNSSRSTPLALGAIEKRATPASANFSSVTSKNPGMADVIAMAPMALGTIEGADNMMLEDEDPTAILNQVVKGGLNSVSALSQEQLDTLNEIQATGLLGDPMNQGGDPSNMSHAQKQQHFANYQARNAYGIKRR